MNLISWCTNRKRLKRPLVVCPRNASLGRPCVSWPPIERVKSLNRALDALKGNVEFSGDDLIEHWLVWGVVYDALINPNTRSVGQFAPVRRVQRIDNEPLSPVVRSTFAFLSVLS